MAFKSLEEEIKLLTKIWAIKESLFKTRPEGNILFKEHLEVEPFTLGQNQVKAWIKKDGKVSGKISYGNIQIDEGGKLLGDINSTDKSQELKNKEVEWKPL